MRFQGEGEVVVALHRGGVVHPGGYCHQIGESGAVPYHVVSLAAKIVCGFEIEPRKDPLHTFAGSCLLRGELFIWDHPGVGEGLRAVVDIDSEGLAVVFVSGDVEPETGEIGLYRLGAELRHIIGGDGAFGYHRGGRIYKSAYGVVAVLGAEVFGGVHYAVPKHVAGKSVSAVLGDYQGRDTRYVGAGHRGPLHAAVFVVRESTDDSIVFVHVAPRGRHVYPVAVAGVVGPEVVGAHRTYRYGPFVVSGRPEIGILVTGGEYHESARHGAHLQPVLI